MRISEISQAAFIDEMEKIAAADYQLVKQSAFLRNLGDAIKTTVKTTGAPIGHTLRDMATRPLAATKAGFKETIRSSMQGGPKMRALNIGLLGLQGAGMASEAAGIRPEEDPTGQGRGRAERLGRFIGGTAGGLIGTRPGAGVIGSIGSGIIGTGVGSAALGYLGRGVDKAVARVKGKGQPMPSPTAVPGHVPPA